MRNPLPATLWFLQHDARHGLLEASGFQKSGPANGHPAIFHRGNFHLYAQGFWLDEGESRLVYHNSSRTFYRTREGQDPFTIALSNQSRVPLEEGFLAVRDILNDHESFIYSKCGRNYRNGLIHMMPTSERRYGKNWKLIFGRERKPVLM